MLRELLPDFFAAELRSLGQPGSAVSTHLSSAVRNELKSVETEIKYAGYLDQQQKAIERLKKAEQRNIPEWFDYARGKRTLARDEREAPARAPADAGAGEPHPWSDAGGGLAGECVYRNPGAADTAGTVVS